MMTIYPGQDLKGRPPALPYAYRPLEQIMVKGDGSSYPKWQHAFQRVGADMSQIFIYFTKIETGSGRRELELVRKLATILQGSTTSPLNSESAWIYFVYTNEAVATELRNNIH